MLRIIPNSNARRAKSYYTASDYYVDGQERAGVWRGEGAKKLGLSGEVNKAEWDALCDGINPKTSEKLLQRRKDDRLVGWDFNFHVPKSVSVLYAISKDERIVEAFRESVDATMRELEPETLTRVRRGGKNEERQTSNLVWGEFVHFTSRPVEGVPDVHLHAHCFVTNATWDKEENRWKAAQLRDIRRDAPYFEAVFHARLARKLADLGLPIERTLKGWEIAGVPKSATHKFSRRTALIEEKAREKGITDAKLKSELGAKTRSRKAKELSMPQLQAEWRGRMSPHELEAIARLEKMIGSRPAPSDGNSAERALTYAIGHEFERRSVVPERKLITTALKQAYGKATPEQVIRQVDRSGVIIGERKGLRMATTREVLGEEQRIIKFAREGRGTMAPLGRSDYTIQRDWLNTNQQAAVRRILESHDRIVAIVRGVAGAGKTTLMKEAVEAIEANGTNVFAFAPSSDASRGVLASEGFKANTVAMLLKDPRLQKSVAGSVIWVDEAGLIGAKTAADLFVLAEKLDCRILLSGDRRQHASVEHGSVLQLLEDEAGIKPAEVNDIKRQAGEYKAAVKALSEGRVEEGFSRLEKLGWIHELPEEERYKQLATDYVEAAAAGKSALIVSPTHAEGHTITDEVRRLLQERGLLGNAQHTFQVLQPANLTEAERGDSLNYSPGDVLQFHQNAKGYVRGQRVCMNGKPLPLDQAQRFTVFHARHLSLAAGDMVRITHNGWTADGKHTLNNGTRYRIKSFDRKGNIVLDNGWTIAKDFGHLAYGYVITSHSSQGKTVDRVFVGQSATSFPASSREQFYVSCSRGREWVSIYCDDKQVLKEAVSQSDERLTAIELINQCRSREVVALHRRHMLMEPEPLRETSYERERA